MSKRSVARFLWGVLVYNVQLRVLRVLDRLGERAQ